MSVRCISQVLEASAHAGTELLILVVLADYSDDEGNSYPAVASLARKCRMSPRNANYILNALQASGELRVLKNEGPKGTNRYRIMLAQLGANPLQAASPLKHVAPLKSLAGVKGSAPLQPASAPPATGFPKPLKPVADEPSLNRQEPSLTSPAAPTTAPKVPNCPQQSIVDLFHERLPALPRVRLMPESRQRAMRKLWRWILTSSKPNGERRATNTEEALAWLGEYFARAAHNDFLMGRTERSGAHANWRCDLDFLLSEKGMRQVIEKTEVAA